MTGLTYIRWRYGVPAWRGARVSFGGKEGVVTGSRESCLRIRLFGEPVRRFVHPLDVTYHGYVVRRAA